MILSESVEKRVKNRRQERSCMAGKRGENKCTLWETSGRREGEE